MLVISLLLFTSLHGIISVLRIRQFTGIFSSVPSKGGNPCILRAGQEMIEEKCTEEVGTDMVAMVRGSKHNASDDLAHKVPLRKRCFAAHWS